MTRNDQHLPDINQAGIGNAVGGGQVIDGNAKVDGDAEHGFAHLDSMGGGFGGWWVGWWSSGLKETAVASTVVPALTDRLSAGGMGSWERATAVGVSCTVWPLTGSPLM